jgi:hypothetical protein
VALTVTYQAALDQQLDAQPYQILLQDAEGNLYPPVYVPRPADSQIPDLQGQLMAPDDRTIRDHHLRRASRGHDRQGRLLAVVGTASRTSWT